MTVTTVPAPFRPARWRLPVWSRAAISILGGLLFGLALGVAIATVLATQLFGWKVLKVESGSMEPALRVGDIVIIKPAAIGDVRKGDIVYFEDGSQKIPLVHRVVAVQRYTTNLRNAQTGQVVASQTDTVLKTRGDANPVVDSQDTRAQQLKGTVWFHIPNVAGVLNLPLQVILFAIAGAIGVLWLIWELVQRVGLRHRHESAESET